LRRLWLLLPFGLAVALGCSRSYYRQQADAETYPIVQERVTSPVAAVGRTQLEPHPLSRIADPSDPDATPKPPDDPAAAAFMAHPYRFKGAKTWGRYGYSDSVEPAGWESALGLEPNGVLKLDQQKSAEVALVNSREYQTALEDVYLTALALTLNRFEFDTQWFNRRTLTYDRVGASSLPAESNTLATTGNVGFSRNLAAGGQLLANFANSFVWEFTGRSHAVTGNFGFTFIQPLIRNFGRDVRLEGLTQAERETLYTVRTFARFRKQFWAGVAVQDGGYLDILLQVQAVRNAKANLKAQEENYALTQSEYRGGRRAVVDVDQALQGLLAARQQILDTEIGLQNSLDGFKLRLGLPPRLPVELDDAPLQQFVVTSPELEKLQDDLTAFDKARKQEADTLPTADAIRSGFDGLNKLIERGDGLVASVDRDLKEWKAVLDRPARPDDDAETLERAGQEYKREATKPDEVRHALKELSAGVVNHQRAVTAETRKEGWAALVADTKKLVGLVDDLVAAQNLSRIYRLDLPAVAAEEATALACARQNRLDLQNQLARVTDAWRQVIVSANALQSDLTLTTAATLVTAPTAKNPFDFSNDASRFSVGLQFDGPLNRQAERNQYRAAQVNYQRARRAYMELSDRIEQDVRVNVRSLRQTRVSFEIARQRLIASARQVANERSLVNAPVNPQQQQRGGGGDATLRTLQALAQLNAARNDLAGRFIQYEQQRVQLLLNLEELQLDDQGFPTNASPPRPDPARHVERDVPPPAFLPAVPPGKS
jgi:outer membrane protein TolC